MDRLHVATLNILNLADRWPERLPLLLADMAALQPDLLGLQEVVYVMQQDRLIGAAGEGHYGVVRGWAGRPEYGNSLLVKEPLAATEVTRLDLGFGRSAHRAVVALPGGATVLVAVTHLHNAVDGAAVGEIEVRGPWITGSYYKDDDPAKFHDGWLRTGDVGTLDEQGFIRLSDRAKDVIKSGGEWISSMELENILMAHPDVAEAAVIGVADDKWGERPLAAVVLRSGAEVSAEKLRAFMTEQIPRWQLPERWCFVAEVPKTSVGKFSKRQMREAYQRGDYEIIEVR